MSSFKRYIGIDYSGAETPTSRLRGIRVFSATQSDEPREQNTSAGLGTAARHMRWNWTRKELAYWLAEQLSGPEAVIVGIDHGFSFPDAYFRRYGLKTWDEFIEDFCKHWPTDSDHTYVDDIREAGSERTGSMREFRLSEKRAKGVQSVFKFDGQGTVGISTHSGIPWLRFLRRHETLSGTARTSGIFRSSAAPIPRSWPRTTNRRGPTMSGICRRWARHSTSFFGSTSTEGR
ncbi:MAG: hypothetical protein ABII00_14175 [Elusimicrobiota bacterium]